MGYTAWCPVLRLEPLQTTKRNVSQRSFTHKTPTIGTKLGAQCAGLRAPSLACKFLRRNLVEQTFTLTQFWPSRGESSPDVHGHIKRNVAARYMNFGAARKSKQVRIRTKVQSLQSKNHAMWIYKLMGGAIRHWGLALKPYPTCHPCAFIFDNSTKQGAKDCENAFM